MEPDAQRGEQDPDQRGAVLAGHRLHRRVVAAAQVAHEGAAAFAGLVAHLPQRAQQGGAFQHEGDRQHHVRQRELGSVRLFVVGQQRADALQDGEAGARHEDPDGGEQRPEEPFLAVAEGVHGVGGPRGPAQ